MATKKQPAKKATPAKKAPAKKAAPVKKVAAPKKSAPPAEERTLTQQSKDENRQAFLDKGFTPEEIDQYPVNFMKKAVRSTRIPYQWVQPNAYRGGV